MSDDDGESGDELAWPDAVRLMKQAHDHLVQGAEYLREMADAGYLEMPDAVRASLFYVAHIGLQHDLQGKAPTRYGDKSPVRLIAPDQI